MNEHVTKKQISLVCRYSYTRLALNYYMYCDSLLEVNSYSKQIGEFQNRLHGLMQTFLKGELLESDVVSLREAIMKHMEQIVLFVDRFQIYENVLNRMEGRFLLNPPEVESEETFTSRVMQFITGTNDHMVVNARIQEIVGELPVRLTKSKFANLVQEGLSSYIGSDKSSLESMLYFLETASMMKELNENKEAYAYLNEMLETFQKADYKSMSKEEYENMGALLPIVVDYSENETNACLMLQDIVNDLYVILLAKKDAFLEAEERNVLTRILSSLTEFVSHDEKQTSEFLDNLEDDIVCLEGKQESYYERYLRNQGEWSDDFKEIGHKIDMLLSGSAFVELEKSENTETADKAYVMKTTAEFIERLLKHLSTLQKPVSRAVMARVLSHLPVFFNSVDEIQNYVRGSLESCADSNEKGTCMELIRSIMESEDALV